MLQWPLTEGIFKYIDRAKSVNELMDSLVWILPVLNPNCGKTEPPAAFRRDGFLAYANGSDWDPGSGKGYYYYDADTPAWVQIG